MAQTELSRLPALHEGQGVAYFTCLPSSFLFDSLTRFEPLTHLITVAGFSRGRPGDRMGTGPGDRMGTALSG